MNYYSQLPKLQLAPDPFIYRIVSVYDGTVLSLDGPGWRIGTQLITYPPLDDRISHIQLWRPYRKEITFPSFRVDGYVLHSLWPEVGYNNFRVVNNNLQFGSVGYCDYNGALPQIWYLDWLGEHAAIRSAVNHSCIQNNGPGKQVGLVPVDNTQILPQHLWHIQQLW